VGITLAVLATAVVDGGKLLDVLSGRIKLDEELMASGELQRAMLFGAACAVPVLLALWYAPALVVFHGCGAVRAMVLSLRASLANWRALTVYGILVAFYAVVVPGTIMGIAALVLPVQIGLFLSVMLLTPYIFLMVATLHISDYVSYRDIFHADEKSASDASVA
jgi:hypothetical protein